MRHVYAQCRVDADHLFPQQIAIKATYPGKKSGSGARFVVLLQTPGQVIKDQLTTGIDQFQVFLLQPAIEQRQITAISATGVIGQAFLQP
ncbi:hypothetical protein D3C81_1386010 [compost metagenome]